MVYSHLLQQVVPVRCSYVESGCGFADWHSFGCCMGSSIAEAAATNTRHSHCCFYVVYEFC